MGDIYYGNTQLRDSLGQIGQWGNQMGGEYIRRAMGYDPQASIDRAAMGSFNQFRRQLGRDIGSLRGQQVGMGRLDTGFATQDEDRLMSDSMARLNEILARNALQGEQLRFQNMQGMGEFGQGMYNNYANNLAGLVQSRAQQEAMDRASRRQMIGNIIGGGLSFAGGFL